MYARLVEIDGIDAARREELVEIARERVVPRLKDIDGFHGFISLFDDERGRVRSVALFETSENADEWEREWSSKREEIVRALGGTMQSSTRYEALFVEVDAAVRA